MTPLDCHRPARGDLLTAWRRALALLLWLGVLCGSAFAAPSFQASGYVDNGKKALTLYWPTHVSGDVALLVVQTMNQTATLSTPAGFVEIASSPQGTGTAGSQSATRLTVFWARATSSAMGSPTVADSGENQVAQIFTFRGVAPSGDPWNVTAGNTASAASSSFSIPGATTTVDDTLVVALVANAIDANDPQASNWSNSTLLNLTERGDVNQRTNRGGGFALATGVKATSGAYAATTGILDSASVQGRISLALRPQPVGTLVAQYRFEDSKWTGAASELTDTAGYSGGPFHGRAIGSGLPTPATAAPARTGTCGYASLPGPYSGGGAFSITGLPVSTTTGANTSVAFWMYWDGANSVMPIGWGRYDLWFTGTVFGFNTSNSDVYGIASAGLANGWHHVAAVFTNGSVTNNQLYIDGVLQTLTQRASSPSLTLAVVQSTLQVGGWTNTTGYRFSGRLDELKVYNGTISQAQVTALMAETHECDGARVWLKADGLGQADNTAVASWPNVAVPANPFAQSTAAKRPVLRKNSSDNINFNPVVTFDGSDDELISASSVLGTSSYNSASWYFVARPDTKSNSILFYEPAANVSGDSGGRFMSHLPWGDNYVYWDAGSCCSYNRVYTPYTEVPSNTIQLWNFNKAQAGVMGSSTSKQDIRRNGLVQASRSDTSTLLGVDSQMALGNGGLAYSGRIAEALLYLGDASLSAAKDSQIQSYLSIKYGLTRGDNGAGTAYPYVSGAGTTVWSSSGFHNDVAGIGYDTTFGLDQRISQNINPSTPQIAIASGSSFPFVEPISAQGASAIGQGGYLLWGHNNGNLSTSALGSTSRLRLTRYWQAQVTSAASLPAQVTLRIPVGLVPSALTSPALVVAGDSGFTVIKSTTPLVVASANHYTVTVSTFANGDYFTIAQTASAVVPPTGFNCVEVGAGVATGRLFTKLAGTAFTVDVLALKADGSVETSYAQDGNKPVNVEWGYASDAACTGWVAASPAVSQTLTFAKADVGRKTSASITVNAAAANLRCRVTDATQSPSIVGCSSDSLAVRPTALTLASSTANADASGSSTSATPTLKAGANFTLTATAVTGYNSTPKLNASKAAAHAGAVQTGTLTGSFGAAAASTGVATGAAFTYSEVGYVNLGVNGVYDDTFAAVDATPGDCTADYSNTLVGGKYGCYFGNTAASAYFGRFIPDHLGLVAGSLIDRADLNTGATESCASNFTYLGEDFKTSFTLVARNAAGVTTQNYTGGHARLGLGSWAGLSFTSSSGTLSQGSAAPSGAWGSSTGNYGSASLMATHRVARPANPVAPSSVTVSARPSYTDGGLTVQTASATAVHSGSSELRFGRLALSNVYGSELLDLPLPVTAQYWSSAGYYVTHTDDSCTALPVSSLSMAFLAATPNLSACQTQLSPTGVRTFGSGQLALKLTQPGVGRQGSVDLVLNLGSTAAGSTCVSASASAATAASLPWLGSTNPTARATFGIYKSPLIYRRENY